MTILFYILNDFKKSFKWWRCFMFVSSFNHHKKFLAIIWWYSIGVLVVRRILWILFKNLLQITFIHAVRWGVPEKNGIWGICGIVFLPPMIIETKKATQMLCASHCLIHHKHISIFFKFKILTYKIISAIPLLRLERGPSGLSLAYSLYGVLFLIYSKMATDLLENFHIFLGKNRFF